MDMKNRSSPATEAVLGQKRNMKPYPKQQWAACRSRKVKKSTALPDSSLFWTMAQSTKTFSHHASKRSTTLEISGSLSSGSYLEHMAPQRPRTNPVGRGLPMKTTRWRRKIDNKTSISQKCVSNLDFNRLAEELDFSHLALGKHVAMLLPPFHECQLNRLVAVNRDKVSILVAVA
jgi:hypothetical protein